MLGSIFCIAFLIADTGSKPEETISTVVLLPLFLLFSCNFLLPVFTNKLVYTKEGIEYITMFKRRFFAWNEFSQYNFVKGVLHAYFNQETMTPARNRKEFLFGDPNDVPLSHFIERCEYQRTWRSDPILATIATIIRESEEAARAAEEQMDWEIMESEE